MKEIDINHLETWYAKHYENKLHGRRIVFNDIKPIIDNLDRRYFKFNNIGYSEKGIPIYNIKIGTGQKKVLIWSQMHGNESTGTKALFDLFNFFKNAGTLSWVQKIILENCSLIFIPLLNPDGSAVFTRANANNIDLNRDAVDLKARESNFLRDVLDKFKPEFCFNLHDQRTIFNVEGTKHPASISFLAPSEDIERSLTKGRKQTMSVIVSMNELLSQLIPNQIGRYTDEFYPTATGDNFQKLGHNTILIEAGHYAGDYERDKVRKFNFYALLQGLYFIASADCYNHFEPYFEIPNNDSKYYDIIHRNVKDDNNNRIDIAYQYKHIVKNNTLHLEKEEIARGDLKDFMGHEEVDFKE